MRNTLKLRIPVLAAAMLLPAGCASHHKTPSTQPAAAASPAPEQYPVIVRLVGRHYTVTAASGPHGVVYSAHGSDGSLIVANAGLDELRQQHPEIYQQLIPGIAEHGEGSNSNRRTASDAQDAVPSADRRGPRAEAILLMSAE
jgi:hypothetical protein